MELPAAGIYQLLVHLPEAATVRVGALGSISFAAGYYVYTGSARRCLPQRVARHRARVKALRWHIDYLTVLAEVVAVRAEPLTPGRRDQECAAHRALAATTGVGEPVRGFGASDCRCRSHLVHLGTTADRWPATG
jgi:sugar fermentation stimulation protein A